MQHWAPTETTQTIVFSLSLSLLGTLVLFGSIPIYYIASGEHVPLIKALRWFGLIFFAAAASFSAERMLPMQQKPEQNRKVWTHRVSALAGKSVSISEQPQGFLNVTQVEMCRSPVGEENGVELIVVTFLL